MPETAPVELDSVPTSQLQAGDIVLEHGMRVRLGGEPTVRKTPDLTVYCWRGTVENVEEVLAAGVIREADLSENVWVEGAGWERKLTGRWWIQGNDRVGWSVLRELPAATEFQATLSYSGGFRVHRAGCPGANDLRHSQHGHPLDVSGTTPEDIAADLYSDFIPGEMTRDEALDHVTFLPCTGFPR
ncbi:hypothetical protein GCM10023196_037170 [Actinoallomurus vinaceus]|uniref:Uncharacterized protein n=1 Tax=Actinoallomurus vinaceus TaxID=1080074 RepID=A0ABP8U9A5_9ACTN